MGHIVNRITKLEPVQYHARTSVVRQLLTPLPRPIHRQIRWHFIPCKPIMNLIFVSPTPASVQDIIIRPTHWRANRRGWVGLEYSSASVCNNKYIIHEDFTIQCLRPPYVHQSIDNERRQYGTLWWHPPGSSSQSAVAVRYIIAMWHRDWPMCLAVSSLTARISWVCLL